METEKTEEKQDFNWLNKEPEKPVYTINNDKKSYEWLKYILEHDKKFCTGD